MQLLGPGIGPLGIPELIIILVIVILIFGAGRLPEVGGAVGRSIKEFRKATKDPEEEAKAALNGAAPPASIDAASDTVFCGECGARNVAAAKFCAACGHAIGTPVS